MFDTHRFTALVFSLYLIYKIMEYPHLKSKHWFVFILLGLIWSSSFMWIKIALTEVDPVTLVAFRVLFGLLFGIAIIVLQKIKVPNKFSEWLPLIILGFTNLALPFFLISWGEKSVDSSVAAILDATVPLFTIFLAHFLLKDDRLNINKIIGLIVGFLGVIVLLSKNIGSTSSTLPGQLAVVLASIFYAGSGVYVRKTTQTVPAIMRSMGPLLSASVIMWITAFVSDGSITIPVLNITWIALLFLGVLGSGLAFVMAFYLIHEIGPTRTSMVTYIFPLGGVLLGVLFLHEQITWQLILGGSLIVSSLLVANRQPAPVNNTI
jgi:drug/metabolite transporter (DMT)-like permease